MLVRQDPCEAHRLVPLLAVQGLRHAFGAALELGGRQEEAGLGGEAGGHDAPGPI